jgi:serine/threonine protein kinase
VWLAHDPKLDREVALKLRHEPLGADEMDAWLHEARAVSRLRHPHIVPVFEADVHEGRPYMVFEWVPGGSLAERLRAARCPGARPCAWPATCWTPCRWPTTRAWCTATSSPRTS